MITVIVIYIKETVHECPALKARLIGAAVQQFHHGILYPFYYYCGIFFDYKLGPEGGVGRGNNNIIITGILG